MSFLKAEKAAGRGDRQTLQDLSRAEAEYEKRLLDFPCSDPAYDGHPGKVFHLCGWRNIFQGLSVNRFLTMQ